MLKSILNRGFLILILTLRLKASFSQDSLIVQSRILPHPAVYMGPGRILSQSVPIYKDPEGSTEIGEVISGKKIYLISPGGASTYLVYVNGITGYIHTINFEFNKYSVNGLNHNNIDWKILQAKRLEEEEVQQNERISASIANSDSIKGASRLKMEISKGIIDGIHVNEFAFSKSRSIIEFDISIMNYHKKSIKYIYITIAGINDVNDVEAIKTFKGVGPISFLNQSFYSFEDAFFSKIISTLKILKISLDFMDGSKKNYQGAELKKTLVYKKSD